MSAKTLKTFDRQTAKFLAVVGENMPEMPADVMRGWIENPKALQRVLRGAFIPPEDTSSSLLELVGTVAVPATTEKFFARERFVVDKSDKAEVKISYLGSDFLEWFSDKVEEPAGETTLRCQRLCRTEVDGPIIAALGGEKKAEITIRELYGFLKQVDKTKWFVCYIRDRVGLLRAVHAGWLGDGCYVDARSVESPCRWDGDGRVVSPHRNS